MFFPSKNRRKLNEDQTLIFLREKNYRLVQSLATYTYLSSNCWISEWLSDVHSMTNDSGSVPAAVDSNFANPAFPKINEYAVEKD